TCDDTDPRDASQFIAGTENSWTLCASGYPPASLSLAGALPQGVAFLDNGDGSATIAGIADIGTGDTYTPTLTMTNAAGTADQALSLDIAEVVRSTSAPDHPTFVAGVPNTHRMSAIGRPTPTFEFAFSDPPDWIALEDHGDGTATLSGTPPRDAVGTIHQFRVAERNGVGNAMFLAPVEVTVAPIGFTAADPPDATVGAPYSYAFAATDPDATFALAGGEKPPAGLRLSRSGVLSGTPTAVGTWRLRVVAKVGRSSVETEQMELTVVPAPHQLQISRFRLVGPTGESDWFVEATNTTDVAFSLDGWEVGVSVRKDHEPIMIPLGTGILEPDDTVLLAGPFTSLVPKLAVNVTGVPRAIEPGGFKVVAPDGTVTDRAGEVGAPADLREGKGVAVPKPLDTVKQAAFVRRVPKGTPLDTSDNARDFRYRTIFDALAPETSIRSRHPSPTDATGARFTFSADQASTFECSLDRSPFAPCASPKRYRGLGEGRHTFKVRAADRAGNIDPSPARVTWRIDTIAPRATIDSGPPDPSNKRAATFEFHADERGTTFECKLGGRPLHSCTSPASYAGLREREHTFRVWATDRAGNRSMVSHTWTVDRTAPQTSIRAAPSGSTTDRTPTFRFESSEGSSTFECSLDGRPFRRCSSPQTYAKLALGRHVFRVRATDLAGNTDRTPASVTWRIEAV
ncbi:MAG: putative Ig domain-containing protein, partial [Actinomycetota bacterium]|nr:putative Ig domain-containing protein [Actinomycetota bacterium]